LMDDEPTSLVREPWTPPPPTEDELATLRRVVFRPDEWFDPPPWWPETEPDAGLPMTAERFLWCREVLGWTNQTISRRLNIISASSKRMAKGTRPIPTAVALFLEEVTGRFARCPLEPSEDPPLLEDVAWRHTRGFIYPVWARWPKLWPSLPMPLERLLWCTRTIGWWENEIIAERVDLDTDSVSAIMLGWRDMPMERAVWLEQLAATALFGPHYPRDDRPRDTILSPTDC
jgi:hypothetical protein